MALVSIGVGSHTLSPAAAASLERCFLAGAPRTKINSSSRTRAQQVALYARYLSDKALRRKPIRYAAKPGTSNHEDPPAIALDIDVDSPLWRWLVKHGDAYGFHRPIWDALGLEPWHFEYDEARDQHKNAVPLPSVQEDDMNGFTVHAMTDAKGVDVDWTLGNADIGADLPQFDDPGTKAMSRTIRDDGDGQVVTMRKGFLSTNIKSVGHAWARIYGQGAGVPTTRLNRDYYIDVQRALSMTAAAITN